MHYIYCYTNKTNGHKYVGQTNNIKRRIREHRSCATNPLASSYNDLIHQKIRQYGEENFSIEVLETLYSDDQQEVNLREQHWIEKLQTFRGTGLGYNSDKGGSRRYSNVLAEEQLLTLKEEIKSGVPFIDLQNKYQISASFISAINHGTYFFDENETYPLFKYYKSDEDYDELIDLLLNSSLSLANIAKQLNMGESTVKKINEGRLRPGLYPSYPIRKKSVYAMKADRIKDLLLNSNLSKQEIMKAVDCSSETVRRINIGESHKDSMLSYPLRNL